MRRAPRGSAPLHAVLLAAALLAAPMVAFGSGEVPRSTDASVVGDSGAFLGLEKLAPVLNASNAYVDDALGFTHAHASGTTFKVYVNNTATEIRFAFVGSPITLSPGESLVVQIEDTNSLHPTGTSTVTAKVEALLLTPTGQKGTTTMTRDLTVTVE